MDVQVGDILVMKKAHPCGSKQWHVLRSGMDFLSLIHISEPTRP